jgi:hypothetical protein
MSKIMWGLYGKHEKVEINLTEVTVTKYFSFCFALLAITQKLGMAVTVLLHCTSTQ